jgi:protease I
MLKLVRDADARKLPIAAICHGPWVLCSTKALKGRKATGFSSIMDDMVNAGATFVDAEVVVDGHVITSRKPDDLPAFTKAILGAIG